MKVFKPWAFQGSLSRNRYFEGWYFKHVSADREQVWSFIPGVSLADKDRHAFIQVLNGRTGESMVYTYEVNDFNASSKELNVNIGNSSFKSKGTTLDLMDKHLNINGLISYSSMESYPTSSFRPGIMGWYSFVPFMECKHGIISMSHALQGGLQIGNKYVNFDGGTGYIEKDWGRSFPESWIWLHCNTFDSGHASFTFSVAKIPWLGNSFMGFISYLKTKDRFINFSTWSGARIENLKYTENRLNLSLVNKKYYLEIEAINNQAGLLKAPKLGSMERIIKETVDANIVLKLCDKSGNIIFMDKGSRAGMELIAEILSSF